VGAAVVKLALVFLLAACAPALARSPAGLNEEAVQTWGFCANRDECRGWAPFARLMDNQGPIYWLLSTGGRACEVDGAIANRVWHPGERWPCEWRTPR
jgi:hypothetical protein